MFRFAQHDKSRLKRIGEAYLWTQQVQAGIRIGLSAVGQMLIKRAHIQFPLIGFPMQEMPAADTMLNVESWPWAPGIFAWLSIHPPPTPPEMYGVNRLPFGTKL